MRLTTQVLLLTLIAAAAVLLWHSPWGYAAQDRAEIDTGASRQHMAGTDELGRDRASRIATAMLLDGAGAIAASAIASTIALGLGLIAAFGTPWIGRTLLYLGDLFLTLPWIFLLMMVRSAMPLNMAPLQSAAVTFLLLGLLGGPAFLRVHYTRTTALRKTDWMLYARSSGLRPAQFLRQLLPHLRPMLLTQFLLYLPACIIAEANLGTLGLGVNEPLASWGSMLQSLQNGLFLGSSHLIYLPIVLLVTMLMALELLALNTKEANS